MIIAKWIRMIRHAWKCKSPGWYSDLYDHHIQGLQDSGLSLRQALRVSVGGDFDAYGRIERDLLIGLGLGEGQTLIDLGCGAGRLAQFIHPVLGRSGKYLGLDVHEGLLEHARQLVAEQQRPTVFSFKIISSTSLPCADQTADFVCAFSVATHIDLEDTYSYLMEMRRVLKPTGKAVISYLSMEIEDHWRIFVDESIVPPEKRSCRVRNHVLVPQTLKRLAEKAYLTVESDIPADRPWIRLTEPIHLDGNRFEAGETIHLGQSCLIVAPNRT